MLTTAEPEVSDTPDVAVGESSEEGHQCGRPLLYRPLGTCIEGRLRKQPPEPQQ